MATHPQRLHQGLVRGRPGLGGPATVVLAFVLFAGTFALRVRDPNAGNAEGILYVLPITLLALRFGMRGGLAGALSGVALIVAWALVTGPASLSVPGYLSRGVALVVLGVFLGAVFERQHRLAAEISRYYDASPDLLATADLTGRFTRVNSAWERTLGHSAATMCSRPFIDFVHPDDRAATLAEAAHVRVCPGESTGFRNRFRTAEGEYRWLQWNTSASPDSGVIHAVARDISAQCAAEQQLADNATWLEATVAARTSELAGAHAETLRLLALAADYRDDDTSQHTERVGINAAPLHDIGKLAIPDSILLKPGSLSTDEYEVIKTHAALGACLLSGASAPVLQAAAVIAKSHHERWDGTGYPSGLATESIPLLGRVVAVADAFDVLTHDRPYKRAWPPERAIAEIERSAGSQFDPRVVAAFLAVHEDAALLAVPLATLERRRPRFLPRDRGVADHSRSRIAY